MNSKMLARRIVNDPALWAALVEAQPQIESDLEAAKNSLERHEFGSVYWSVFDAEQILLRHGMEPEEDRAMSFLMYCERSLTTDLVECGWETLETLFYDWREAEGGE
jgi:hypothetical protein